MRLGLETILGLVRDTREITKGDTYMCACTRAREKKREKKEKELDEKQKVERDRD